MFTRRHCDGLSIGPPGEGVTRGPVVVPRQPVPSGLTKTSPKTSVGRMGADWQNVFTQPALVEPYDMDIEALQLSEG